MRLFIAAVALAAMVGSAAAQAVPPSSQIGQHLSKAEADTDKDKPKVKADEKAYNAALHTIPNKQYDPWRGVR